MKYGMVENRLQSVRKLKTKQTPAKFVDFVWAVITVCSQILCSRFLFFQESMLVAGVAFKKTFSYAGFEMQRKKYDNPKIALLNVELELKAEKENAEVRVDSVEV